MASSHIHLSQKKKIYINKNLNNKNYCLATFAFPSVMLCTYVCTTKVAFTFVEQSATAEE
jgi:hypothetical protein